MVDSRQAVERTQKYDAISWRTDPENCERCSEIQDLPCDEHGLLQEWARLAAALADTERERSTEKVSRLVLEKMLDDLEPSPDGGYGPDNGRAWKDAYLDRLREKLAAEARVAELEAVLQRIDLESQAPHTRAAHIGWVARRALGAHPSGCASETTKETA